MCRYAHEIFSTLVFLDETVSFITVNYFLRYNREFEHYCSLMTKRMYARPAHDKLIAHRRYIEMKNNDLDEEEDIETAVARHS